MGNCFGRPPRRPPAEPLAAPTPPPPQSKRRDKPLAPDAAAARLARARTSAAATGVLSLTHLDLPAIPPDVTAPPPLPAVRAVALSHNRLTALPAALPAATPAATRLDAAHNRLTAVAAVGGWDRLRRLDVSHNALGGVAVAALLVGAAGTLPALEELDASHNPLGPVLSPPPATAGVGGAAHRPPPALRVLRLEGCGLQAITVGVVGGLAASLTELHVGGNAGLAALPPDVTGLARLTVLAAAGCGLSALPVDLFRSLPALTAVRLSGNAGLTMGTLVEMDGYSTYEARRVEGVDKALGGGVVGGGGGFAEPADR